MELLPEDIIKQIIDYCDIQTWFSFYVNKSISKYIDEKDWKKIWLEISKCKKTAIIEFDKKSTPTLDNEYKDVVRLAGFTGCMICKRKNIRKVWWEYRIRSCPDCLYEKTVGEWEFENKIPKNMYENLPYTTKQMYNRYFGNYIIKFYWKQKINELLLLIAPPPEQIPEPPKSVKPKKIPTEKDIQNQNHRKEETDKLCVSHNISLDDALQYSETYNKNRLVMAKLQKKSFVDFKIPEIQKEITQAKAAEVIENIRLENIRLEKIKQKQQETDNKIMQTELLSMWKEDALKFVEKQINVQEKNFECDLCEKSSRKFSLLGLQHHRRDVHKMYL
jgi:hypothetical protein